MLWGKHYEMKKMLHGLLPLEENETHKSVETLVVSSSNINSSVEMKMMEDGTRERKEVAMASCH